jgi:farnesyl-diphosphate farnesyltransferase
MAAPPNGLLTRLLKDVSRSFYLTLRVLPSPIRTPIGLAYLLARTTDTIADTGLVPLEQRLSALQRFRNQILDADAAALDFADLAQHQGSAAERVLLEQSQAALALLQQLPAPDRNLIRQVLATITSGQELDLRRFAGASARQPAGLQTDAELEDYTYRVAGCVGEFWTKMCRAHVFPRARIDDALLLSRSVQFGKGLQLVNILRDLPADLAKGRCYLPSETLAPLGLSVVDLQQPASEPRLRPVYDRYLDRAADYLAAGWSYTDSLPWKAARVRLACAWPVLIGMQTIARLRHFPVLDPRQRVKISRRELRRIMLQTVLRYPWPAAWRRLFPHPASGAGKAVASGAIFT